MTIPDWLDLNQCVWPAVALRYQYEVQLGKMLDEKRISGEHLRPYLRNADVQWGEVNLDGLPTMDFDEEDRAKYSLCPGDILVCEGGEVGRAAIWPDGIVGQYYFQKALHRLRPLHTDELPRFMFYALQAAAEQNAYGSGGKATIAHLPADAFRRVRFPKPNRRDQERVANFLDEQTARIDALIAEKKRLQEAVDQLFQARLGTAVVEGLGGAGVMRAAPTAGFEKVRADWALIPLKHLASAVGGMTPPKDREDFWQGSIPWVSPKDMKQFILHDSQDHISESAIEQTSLKRQPVNSVLIVVRGMILAHTFPVAMNAVPVTINQDMKALRPKERVSAAYLAWMLRGLQALVLSLTEESAHGTKALRTDQLFNQAVPVPSEKEQCALVTAFEQWEKESSNLAMHLMDHIARLREYRSSLILAAVTGQLDITLLMNSATAQNELQERMQENVA